MQLLNHTSIWKAINRITMHVSNASNNKMPDNIVSMLSLTRSAGLFFVSMVLKTFQTFTSLTRQPLSLNAFLLQQCLCHLGWLLDKVGVCAISQARTQYCSDGDLTTTTCSQVGVEYRQSLALNKKLGLGT